MTSEPSEEEEAMALWGKLTDRGKAAIVRHLMENNGLSEEEKQAGVTPPDER